MTGGLAIIWHSRTGTARAMVEAAASGAETEGAYRLIEAASALPEDLLDAAGYLFCCPENLGSMTGEMKAFFDRCYYPLLGRIEGRAYSAMIAAGTDGSGAERQLHRIVTGWRLRRAAETLIIRTGAQTPEEILAAKRVPEPLLQDCHNLGRAMAAGLALGVF